MTPWTRAHRSAGHLVAMLVVLCALLATGVARAPISSAQSGTPGRKISVPIVLDDSGSMSTSDPQNLRTTGARLFTTLVDLNDRVALVEFSSASHVRANLTRVDSSATKDRLGQTLVGDARGNTDSLSALRDAYRILDADESDNTKFVVFLTDGEPDPDGIAWRGQPPSEVQPYLEDIRTEVAAFRERGWRIYSVSLYTVGDWGRDWLQNMAATTGGKYYHAPETAALDEVFDEIFADLKQEVLEPVCNSAVHLESGQVRDCSVTVDRFVREVKFKVSRGEGIQVNLLAPDGRAPQSEHHQDPSFDVYIIDQPQTGRWTVRFSGTGDARPTVFFGWDVEAHLASPKNGFQTQSDPMRLAIAVTHRPQPGAGGVPAAPEPLLGARVMATIKPPLGPPATLTLAPDGDVYAAAYPNTGTAGDYFVDATVEVLEQGRETVVAEIRGESITIGSFPKPVIDAPDVGTLRVDPGESIPVSLRPSDGAAGNQTMDLELLAPDGQVRAVPLSPSSRGFGGQIRPTLAGDYVLRATLKGTFGRGAAPFTQTVDRNITIDLGLPTVSIAAPEAKTYVLRYGEKVPIRIVPIRDGSPAEFDTGTLEVQVSVISSRPAVEPTTIALAPDGPGFSGAFDPPEDGQYRVQAVLQGRFKSVPVESKSVRDFVAQPAPVIALSAPTTDLGKLWDLGRQYDVIVHTDSNASSALPISVSAAADAAFDISADSAEVALGPQDLVVHLRPHADLREGRGSVAADVHSDAAVTLLPGPHFETLVTYERPGLLERGWHDWWLWIIAGVIVVLLLVGSLLFVTVVAPPKPLGVLTRVTGLGGPAQVYLPRLGKVFMRDRITIGSAKADIVLPSTQAISRRHARLIVERGVTNARIGTRTIRRHELRYYMQNIGGANTRVNGTPVVAGQRMRFYDGSRLAIGGLEFTYANPQAKP